MLPGEDDLDFATRAMNEIEDECATGKDHNFNKAIRALVSAIEEDRKRIANTENRVLQLESHTSKLQ